MDALLAADWCFKGLAIEVTKTVQGAKNARRKSATEMHRRNGGAGDSQSEDESHEGKHFGLERALDLVVGVSCYSREPSAMEIEVVPTAHGFVPIRDSTTGSCWSHRRRI